MDSLGGGFVSELVGTAILVLLGDGVVASALLARSKGLAGGWLMICAGWGLGVFAGVNVAYSSGAQLNPAVTLGLLVIGKVDLLTAVVYVVAQLIGAIVGAVLVWLVYKQHYDAEEDQAAVLGTFSTGPAIRSYGWNFVTEVIATFVLVFVIIGFTNGGTPAELGALPVALLVIGIGISLGGPTGWAINPARDLGPRLVHAILPIRGKGGSDWSYSWVPVAGPLVGGLIAGVLSLLLLPIAS